MNKSSLIISIASLCVAIAALLLVYTTGGRTAPGQAWTAENQRELANKLKSAGLARQAVQEYEQYIQTARLEPAQLAGLCYTIGKMCMEAGDYEKALAWLYRVELADPQTKLKPELGSSIINCLERTGRHSAAEYALAKRSSAADNATRSGGTVVAEIGNDKVYLEDVNEAFDNLPDWMRKQFETKSSKAEFAKKYIADELLFRKALKLELDKDADIRKKMKMAQRELMVNRVLESELKDKLKVEEDDLKNFYEAHKAEYEQKEAVKVSLIEAVNREAAEKIYKELKGGRDFGAYAKEISLNKNTAKDGGRFPTWVRRGEDDLGIGSTEAVAKALFSAKKGELLEPVQAGESWFVFRVDDTRAAQPTTYDEAKERVKNDYSMQKLKSSYQSLLEQTLKSSDVKLHLEAVTGEGKK
ncbi:MAG: peptidyl-prolyl cis-trans isomerase [Deltaproteobacteria bacterium]|nr:peptidyl-prolyl cis-trans isomerase [Deltaproteobacteria bacterium]